MQVFDCDISQSDEILKIFNDAIVNSTALYDYKPRTSEMMRAWFETKSNGNFPIVGLASDANELMAFGSYGTFRNFPAYKYTVEHSLYVAERFRGRGLGKWLMAEIIKRAKEQDYHVMIGAIDAANAASIALHDRFGFKRVGTLPQVGFKSGKWLDLSLYQLILNTPGNPVDG